MQAMWGAHRLTGLTSCSTCRPPVNSTPQVCWGEDSTVVGNFYMSLTLGGAGGNVGRDADSDPTGVGRDADGAPTGFERNQGTAHVSDRLKSFESSVDAALGNRLDRMEEAIQNLTQCMDNLVESKQAAGAPGPVAQGRDPSRGHVNDCQTSISGKLTHSLGVPTCVD